MTVGGVIHPTPMWQHGWQANTLHRNLALRPDTIPDRQDPLIIACGGRCSAKLIAHVAQR
jgi:hypothetical protein